MSSVIEVRGLRMRYGTVGVLDGVDFTARRGEVVVLLGPNGAGKTTTIEILEGFRARSAGEVSVLGADPAKADEHWRAGVGIVLQSWRDHGRWRVAQLLRHLGRYYAPYSTPQRPRPRDVDELIEAVGLGDRASARIATLSGGERRRMDVAIGIIGRPEVLFLDEPTAGLDPVARRGFHDLVHRLSDLEDTTILLTTHDLDEAEKLADRILILDRGRIVADGSADQLCRRVSGMLVPALFLVDGLAATSLAGWLTFGWVLALGLLATLPLGLLLGGLTINPRVTAQIVGVGSAVLIAISGIFYPISGLPSWLHPVAQLFPFYWLGLGMRSALLPDSAAAVELSGSWRHLETAAVLGAWAVIGLALAPVVLRRMARRESGATVEAGRQKATQRIG